MGGWVGDPLSLLELEYFEFLVSLFSYDISGQISLASNCATMADYRSSACSATSNHCYAILYLLCAAHCQLVLADAAAASSSSDRSEYQVSEWESE